MRYPRRIESGLYIEITKKVDRLSKPAYVSVIERAQQGDVLAFNELVGQFQDLAVGTAYAWLGEIEAARDVSQEAFLEAHRALGQLREPAAFPGWFRRIVTKHCDRVTRRTTLDISSNRLPELVSSDATLESDLVADRQKERLRMAVDALPPGPCGAAIPPP